MAERSGATAYLIQRARDIDPQWFEGVDTVGLTAGASAPELLVTEVRDWLGKHFETVEEKIRTAEERMIFKLPRGLEAA